VVGPRGPPRCPGGSVVCPAPWWSQNYGKDQAAELRDLLEMASLNLDQMPWNSQAALRCNNVAWELVKGPLKDRQPDKALALARKAVELAPDSGDYRNTLGVIYYRAGRHRDAVTTLESNLQYNVNYAAFDLYFLAMSCHQLGEVEKAKDYLDRAVRWDDQKRAGLPQHCQTELKAFRAEAEELLGVKESKEPKHRGTEKNE
jgi:tetratricopeptide (TPR) repeat protein